MNLVINISSGYSASYHVDASAGNDAGDGSLNHPWQTLERVNLAAPMPGDQVLFKRGGRWHGTLTASSSGTGDAPVVFGAYGEGPKPEIDCTLLASDGWLAMGNNIYSRIWRGRPGVLLYRGTPRPSIFSVSLDPSVRQLPARNAILLLEGNPYTNLRVLAVDNKLKILSGISVFESKWDTRRRIKVRQVNPATGKEEQWEPLPPAADITPKMASLRKPGHWYWHGGRIFLYSDTHPSKADVRVGALDYGINTNGMDHVIIRDLTVRGANIVGAFLLNSDNCVLENCSILATGMLSHRTGVLLMNSSHNNINNNKIESSLVTGIGVYAHDALSHYNTISGNDVSKSGSSGILIGGEEPFRVAHNLIKDNRIERSNQIAYDSAGVYTYFCGKGNVIEGNTISNGGSKVLRGAGIMVDVDSGPMMIRDNMVENNSLGGIVVTGSGHEITNNRLRNDGALHWPSAEIVFFPVTTDAADCVVQNNYLQAGAELNFISIAKGSEKGHRIDHNEYQGGSARPFVYGDAELEFTAWREKTLYDGHSRHVRGE